MSKKVKLQDLSISRFDQELNVEGIKGGASAFCRRVVKITIRYIGSIPFLYPIDRIVCSGRAGGGGGGGTGGGW